MCELMSMWMGGEELIVLYHYKIQTYKLLNDNNILLPIAKPASYSLCPSTYNYYTFAYQLLNRLTLRTLGRKTLLMVILV